MSPKPKITLLGLEFVQTLKSAIRDRGDAGLLGLRHRLPVSPPEGGSPRTFTVCLVYEPGGEFVATCRELPELVVFARTEHDALAKVEFEIRHQLASGRSL